MSGMPGESDTAAVGRVEIEPIQLPDMTAILPHFSVSAQDETIAPLHSRERERSLSGNE